MNKPKIVRKGGLRPASTQELQPRTEYETTVSTGLTFTFVEPLLAHSIRICVCGLNYSWERFGIGIMKHLHNLCKSANLT